MKALLDFSAVGYDNSEFVIKALVNCSRFSWLRLRLIEYGAINNLHNLMVAIPTWKHNKHELVFHMLTALRSLSESSGCRTEMIQKSTIDLLVGLTPHCTDKDRLLIVKMLHNFLSTSTCLSAAAFSTTVTMLYDLVFRASYIVILQYCAACLHMVTKEKIRGQKQHALKIIETMSILLPSKDPITQFFAISTSGNLFFGNLVDDHSKLELLIQYFVMNGASIEDPNAKQALALALAKLSEEEDYLAVIERLHLLDKVLHLLMHLRREHKESLVLQESCCIAIVRIALKMDDLLNAEERSLVSELLLDMLDIDDKYVLTSTISGIRAMGSTGLCPKEFLANKLFLSKIGAIVMKHNKQTDLCRYGCAVLAVFSYDVEAHDLLAEKLILNVLFANIRSEDAITRELVANTLCNLSLHPLACETMINMNVVELLGELSSSTSETILDLCSKSLCNLTCNKALHQSMIQNNVLEILLMISLVRTVSSHTKCTCAKALLNLMTDENIMMITSSGAIRIFASLASNPFSPVQKVCSKGFHLMTINVNRRREFVKNRAVLHSLFNMMKGTSTTSSRVKNRLGISIINLLSCPETNFDAIKAGALSCLKVVATLGHEQLRDATGRLIITLASDIKFHSLLAKEPIVPMLILILQEHETPEVFEVAIQGLCCLAGFETFKKIMFRDKAIEAMIGTIFSGKVSEIRIAREICRSFTHLSFVYEQIDSIIATNAFAIALSVMDEAGLTAVNDCRTLLFILARNLSEPTIARKYLVDQGIFQLLVKILLRDSYEVSQMPPPVKGENSETPGIKSLGYAIMLKIILNLSSIPQLHVQLMQQGLMPLIRFICLPIHSTSSGIISGSSVPPSMEVIAEDSDSLPVTPGHLSVQNNALFTSNRSRMLTQARTPSSRSFIVSPTGSLPSHHPVLRKHQSLEAIPIKDDSANNNANDDNSGDENSVGSYNDDKGSPQKKGVPSNQSNNQNFRAAVETAANATNAHKSGVSHHAPAQSNNDKPGETHFRLYFSFEQVEDITKSLQLLSQSPSCHEEMVEAGIMEICKALIYADLTPVGRSEMSACLAQIAQSKSCRESLVQQGAVEMLIALWVNGDSNTQAQCATALAYLSEITIVQKGIVASLLLLDLAIEGKHGHNQNHHSPGQLMGALMSHAGRLGPANIVAIKEISHQMRHNLVNPSQLPSVSSASSVLSGTSNGGSLKTGSIDSSVVTGANEGVPPNALSTAHDGSAVKTLSSTLLELLRDLMPDKRKYDDYRAALQTYHEANMSSNEFQPPKNNIHTHKNLIETRRQNNARSSPAVSDMRQSQDYTKSAPFTRLAISLVHETYLTAQEHAALKVSFEEFTFTPPVNNPGYKPEFGGLSKELTVQLKLPTIPTDRDLEPVNRHDELAKMPINEDPLPKDTGIPPNSNKSHAELLQEEEDRKAAEEAAANAAAVEATNEAAAASALAANNGKPALNVVTGVGNGRKGSVLNKVPSGGVAGSGRPTLAKVGKFASVGDNLGKSKGLDYRRYDFQNLFTNVFHNLTLVVRWSRLLLSYLRMQRHRLQLLLLSSLYPL